MSTAVATRDRTMPRWRLEWYAAITLLIIRALDVVLVTLAGRTQQAIPVLDIPDSPHYLEMMRVWDGAWFEAVVTDGYPSELPIDAQGHVEQNAWAFYPLFPVLVRLAMSLTGLSFGLAGTLVAVALGTAAAVVMVRLFALRLQPGHALMAAALWSAAPPSPILQFPYSDGAGMLVLCSALYLMERRRWVPAAIAVVIMGLTRPLGLPLGALAILVAFWRWRGRAEEPVARGETASLCGLVLAGLTAGWLWPGAAAVRTGVATAYVETQRAWIGADYVPGSDWWSLITSGPAGVVLVLIFLGPVGLTLSPRLSSRLGLIMRAWPVLYVAFLVAAVPLGSNIVRYLLACFPWAAVLIGVAGTRSSRRPDLWFAGWLTLCVVGQVAYVFGLIVYVPPVDMNP